MNPTRRGTTPYITFTTTDNIDLSAVKTVWLSVKQSGSIVIDKTTSDLTINSKSISIRLSQEDTLKLEKGVMAYIQIRLLTDTDLAYATDEEYMPIEDIIKDGVIV